MVIILIMLIIDATEDESNNNNYKTKTPSVKQHTMSIKDRMNINIEKTIKTDVSNDIIIFDCPLNSIETSMINDETKAKQKKYNDNNNINETRRKAMDFIFEFNDNKKPLKIFQQELFSTERMILMFYSNKNDRIYILTKQIIKRKKISKNSRKKRKLQLQHDIFEYKVYLRLIELNGKIICKLFEIYQNNNLTFSQLIKSNGIIIYCQKEMGKDLSWTYSNGYFICRESACDSIYLLNEWIFNDNDNCIIACNNTMFVTIPIQQLLFTC